MSDIPGAGVTGSCKKPNMVLRIELRFSGRAASALNPCQPRAISQPPSPLLLLFCFFSFFFLSFFFKQDIPI